MSTTYGLGGTEVKQDANEAIQDIPQNRTLLVEKLTANTPVKPEFSEGLKTVEEVFAHYQPKIDIDFEDNKGKNIKETLAFKNLGDFGAKGITNQSQFLRDLATEKEQFQKVIKQLKNNKRLRAALTDPEAKQALIKAIKSMISELD